MISSILIIFVSLVLLAYWFRYTCLLILRTQGSRDFAAEVASANNLAFPLVAGRLREQGELDTLDEMLGRDFRLLMYLLRHTASFEVGGFTIEQRLLRADFRLMQVWYALTSRIAAPQARGALEEMSQIVSHFANVMGERIAATSRG